MLGGWDSVRQHHGHVSFNIISCMSTRNMPYSSICRLDPILHPGGGMSSTV